VPYGCTINETLLIMFSKEARAKGEKFLEPGMLLRNARHEVPEREKCTR
jgi:hypothetical protein